MAAQYVHDDTGTYIPATQRPDGTWRKARRVKDGYIPQDEMPLYESKGKQWAKSKPTLPVGLDPSYSVQTDRVNDIGQSKIIPGLGEIQTAPKPSKKKKKKKNDATKDQVINDMQKLKISAGSPELPNNLSENSEKKTNPPTEPLKRLRNLRKKLKEINALQSKIESGELPNPEKDQLEKVARKEEIESEIELLLLEMFE